MEATKAVRLIFDGETMLLRVLKRCPSVRAGTSRICLPVPLGHRHVSSGSSLLRVSEEVTDALKTGKPVVALETTIYTHGWRHTELLRCTCS